MFAGGELGAIHEPLTGRHWDRTVARRQVAARTAAMASIGIGPGHRVFLHLGSTLEFFGDLLAIWNRGASAVPIDARLTEFEVENLCRAAMPSISIWNGAPDPGMARRLQALGVSCVSTLDAAEGNRSVAAPWSGQSPALDDDALILFTSGTTGQPKGVVHTHRSLRARWITLRQSLGIAAFERTLCLLPTHFGHGLICNSLFPWLYGKDLFILPPFKPEIVMRLGSILDEHEITFMSSVPSVWRMALKVGAPPKRRTLHRVFCGSAPLSGFLWNQAREWTGASQVCNAYGITETGSWVAGTTVDGVLPEDGLIGVPWGAEIRILRSRDPGSPPGTLDSCRPGEEGHVWLNTPALMRGYLDRDDLTSAVVSQGWFLTGDIGVLDDRGLLYLRGREREEINKGGMKVHPGDVDAVVEQYARATDVCTFAFEDALYGEDVAIAVVLSGDRERELIELKAWTRVHLAEHKVPRRWYVVDEIPRTSRGKINRADVAKVCASRDFVAL